MISSTLNKGLSLFKSNPITEQIDFASKKSIPIRHLAIG
ncbi:MAG: metal-dependent hydrolase, partial [Acinetobacter junii]